VKDVKEVKYLSWDELAAGLTDIQKSPRDEGALQLIVRRPGVDQRELLTEGQLEPAKGLVGDSWSRRRSSRTPDGSPHPDMQLNIMNARVIALIAQHKDRWPLAGDQLYVDLDLSAENLPAGTRLALGSAVIEVTSQPHTGCRKVTEHVGTEATRFVNSTDGKALRLRGVNAKVVQPGTIRVGDLARKL
jgi:hypothetical protein